MNWLQRKKLFIVYNKAMAKAKASPNADKLQDRIRKAFGILQHHDYYQAEKAKYSPTAFSCGCEDWKWRNSANRDYDGHCKHMIAVILEARVKSLAYEQATFLELLEAVQTASVEFTGKVWVNTIL